MTFDPSPTELTTAATDLLLALAIAVGAVSLLPHRRRNPWRAAAWLATLAALGTAAVLGGAVHGLVLGAAVETWLWRLITIATGATAAAFAAVVLEGWRGRRAATRALPWLLTAVLVHLLATELSGGSYLPTALLQGGVMAAALVVCTAQALGSGARQARALSLGIALTLVAALVQGLGLGAFHLVFSFDHNGAYHLVQVIALVPLLAGARWSLIDDPGRCHTGP